MFYFIGNELKYYFKNKAELLYLYSYFISITVMLPFAAPPGPIGQASLAVLGLWVALASAVAIGAQGLFRRDQEQGRLEYYQLLPLRLELVVAAKWLAFYLFVLLPLLAAIPVAGLLLGPATASLGHMALGLAVGAAGLSMLATLVAALLSGIEKAGALLSLLVLPLSIPILIFGADYCRAASADSSANLMLMLGFSGFMLPIMCWVGASGIRAGN